MEDDDSADGSAPTARKWGNRIFTKLGYPQKLMSLVYQLTFGANSESEAEQECRVLDYPSWTRQYSSVLESPLFAALEPPFVDAFRPQWTPQSTTIFVANNWRQKLLQPQKGGLFGRQAFRYEIRPLDTLPLPVHDNSLANLNALVIERAGDDQHEDLEIEIALQCVRSGPRRVVAYGMSQDLR